MNPRPIPDLAPDHKERMERVLLALDGLSVGDAFGGQFFLPANQERLFSRERQAPPPGWGYTDDTEMALGIYEVLNDYGEIVQDELARVFARRYEREMYRGYGAGAHRILSAIHRGLPWREVAAAEFGGMGSMGNGAAMRVAPVGAYFADDYSRVVEQARRSAEVTHAHPEGIAGGIAVAVATAFAWQHRETHGDDSTRRTFFDVVLDHTPAGETRNGMEHAAILPLNLSIESAVSLLGNGIRITAPDTVPFCLWCAARHLGDYAEALWTVARAGGDVDTNGAIVGGIVVMANGWPAVPKEWLEARESLAYKS
jgi:ADP-ribosylglycohydrolase